MRLGAIALGFAVAFAFLPARTRAADEPSFDCAKAVTPVEKLICSDSQSAADDRSMADAYRTLIGNAGPARDDIVLIQRDWLRQRAHECLAGATGDADRESELACLRDLYHGRSHAISTYASMSARPKAAPFLDQWIVIEAFAFMLRNPAAAEKIFRERHSLQAKLGLALVLRLVRGNPRQHDAEVRRLFAEIGAADVSEGKIPILSPQDKYDGSVESMVPFIQAVAGPVDLPCGLIERYPPLLSVLNPYFGSSRDSFMPGAACSRADYPIPMSVEDFERAVFAYDGGAFDRCTGTMRSTFARDFERARIERQILPRSLLAEVAKSGKTPEWASLDQYPLQRWSYQSAWNRLSFLRVRGLFREAREDLAKYYHTRFGLAPDEALRAAHIGLWNGIQYWTFEVQPVPRRSSVAIMDGEDDSPPTEVLPPQRPASTDAEPDLSLAVVRPEAIISLLADHADVNATNEFGKTPLMTAAQFNRIDAIRVFLKAGANVNAVTRPPDQVPNNDPRDDNKPWSGCGFYAIRHGSRTALMYAAANASLTVIKELLAAGADKSNADSAGSTALDYLTGKGPVPRNPLLSGADIERAIELLSK